MCQLSSRAPVSLSYWYQLILVQYAMAGCYAVLETRIAVIVRQSKVEFARDICSVRLGRIGHRVVE